jgi:dethiobiotin synthetase
MMARKGKTAGWPPALRRQPTGNLSGAAAPRRPGGTFGGNVGLDTENLNQIKPNQTKSNQIKPNSGGAGGWGGGKEARTGKILFVTGTDTGVGKTVLTAMLLAFFRGRGGNALAMKPFCSGSRGDARLLLALQNDRLALNEVNPFYFDKPLAPAVAAGRGRAVPMEAALEKIRGLAAGCDLLIVEGVGGLVVPLGKEYTVRDLIRRLKCRVIVVCPNRLGVINHAVLTAEALEEVGIKELAIAMMGVRNPDLSAASNAGMLRQMVPSVPVFYVPNLGLRASAPQVVKKNAFFLKKTLALLAGEGIVSIVLTQNERD